MLIPNPLIAYGVEGAARYEPRQLLFAERVTGRTFDGFRDSTSNVVPGRERRETEHADSVVLTDVVVA
jgi:hypothetical protein